MSAVEPALLCTSCSCRDARRSCTLAEHRRLLPYSAALAKASNERRRRRKITATSPAKGESHGQLLPLPPTVQFDGAHAWGTVLARSEEHTSELQSHSFISYA